MRSKLKKKVKIAVISTSAIYLMVGSLLSIFQEKLLFLPNTLPEDYTFKFQKPFEELFFETEEDTKINAIHFKAENPKGVMLYFHGNAGDLSRWGLVAEFFVDFGYDVLIPDYRTYGKSKGKLSEEAFYTDAEYCYQYLLKHYQKENILLYGRSLGTGIASYLAAEHNPKQLILETPYYSIADVAKHRFPIFPVERLLNYKFPNYKFLPKADTPITIIHGTNDAIVPYSSAKKLYDLNIPNLDFVTIENGGHNNLIEFTQYQEVIEKLLHSNY